MKKILLAISMTGVGSAAMAGSPEVPRMEPVLAAPAPAPVFNWTGPYAGVQLGYLDSDLKLTGENLNNNNTMSSSGINASGFVGGVYAGYNWQNAGNFVYGIEGELNYVDANKSGPGVPSPSFGFMRSGIKSEIDMSAALRGRVGYAMDRTLLYLAGGLALADVSLDGFNNSGKKRFSYSETLTGWTIGAGVEHAFTDNWVARLDYRYSDFGSDSFDFASPGKGTPHRFKLKAETHEIRVGFAYKF